MQDATSPQLIHSSCNPALPDLDITAFLPSSESSPTPTPRPVGKPPAEGWWLSPSHSKRLRCTAFTSFRFHTGRERATEMSNLSSFPHFKRGTHQQSNGFWEGPCRGACCLPARGFLGWPSAMCHGKKHTMLPCAVVRADSHSGSVKISHSRGSFFKTSHQSSDEIHLLCSLGLRYFLVIKAIQLAVGTIHYLRPVV